MVKISEYLIPLAIEKKENAEISTPWNIRKEMLDTIDPSFWSNKSNRVFEPCCGKGGFVFDVYLRFLEGLQSEIPDLEERKRWIVENCVFFGDINSLNVFITRLLLDPEDKYFLQYYIGDTLQLNPLTYFNISHIDLTIGNPPYSTDPSQQNTTALYNLFTEKYISSKMLKYVKGFN